MDLIVLCEVDSLPLLESFRVMPGDPVTIRKLSAGDYRKGNLHDQDGSILRIGLEQGRFEPGKAQPEFATTDLVEVTCPQTLCLGEIQGREGEVLIVNVEHSIDRAALAAIQQVWYRPESE